MELDQEQTVSIADRLLKQCFVTICSQRTLAAFLACVSAACLAQPTSAELLSQRLAQPASPVTYLPLLSDFDGDRRLDQVELHVDGSHHCIRVRFGNFHETHLDFGARFHSEGILLVRDVNSDNSPDLIWAYRSRLEPALVWLNDGAGNFAESSDQDAAKVSNALFGDTDYEVAGATGYEPVCLAATRPSLEFVAIAILEHDSRDIGPIKDRDSRLPGGTDLSCLRERGPPQHAC